MQLEQVVKSIQLLETQLLLLLLLLHPFNGLFSRTTWVSQLQKGKTSIKARDDGVSGWQWHQLNNMQTICIAPDGAIQSARPHQHLITQFLQARCSSWCPTNSVKALNDTTGDTTAGIESTACLHGFSRFIHSAITLLWTPNLGRGTHCC